MHHAWHIQVPSGQTLTWLMFNEIARSHHLCFGERRAGTSGASCHIPGRKGHARGWGPCQLRPESVTWSRGAPRAHFVPPRPVERLLGHPSSDFFWCMTSCRHLTVDHTLRAGPSTAQCLWISIRVPLRCGPLCLGVGRINQAVPSLLRSLAEHLFLRSLIVPMNAYNVEMRAPMDIAR